MVYCTLVMWRISCLRRIFCESCRPHKIVSKCYSKWNPPIFQRDYSQNVSREFSNRGPVTWATLAVMILAGGGVVVYVNSTRKEQEELKKKNSSKSVGKPDLGGPFQLTDHNGKECTDKDYIGKWLIVYFGFTFCPDICPDELDKLTAVLNKLDEMKEKKGLPQLEAVFVTVDPDRDTPEIMKKYLKDFHPRILGLTGSHDQLHDVTRAYRVYYSPSQKDEDGDYLVDHTIIMYLMGPDGKFVNYYGQNRTVDEMIKSIVLNMKKYHKQMT